MNQDIIDELIDELPESVDTNVRDILHKLLFINRQQTALIDKLLAREESVNHVKRGNLPDGCVLVKKMRLIQSNVPSD